MDAYDRARTWNYGGKHDWFGDTFASKHQRQGNGIRFDSPASLGKEDHETPERGERCARAFCDIIRVWHPAAASGFQTCGQCVSDGRETAEGSLEAGPGRLVDPANRARVRNNRLGKPSGQHIRERVGRVRNKLPGRHLGGGRSQILFIKFFLAGAVDSVHGYTPTNVTNSAGLHNLVILRNNSDAILLAAHEIGHVFGLPHVFSIYNLMCGEQALPFGVDRLFFPCAVSGSANELRKDQLGTATANARKLAQ